MKIALPKLDRKLLRDLLRMKMQMAAVSAVLACGVVLAVMANGMYDSLERARDRYYAQYRMADMAAAVVRAPLSLVPQLDAVPGVRALEARVAGIGLLDMPGRSDPVSARLISLPPDHEPRVNSIVLRSGRMPNPARSDEVLVNEAFAEANKLTAGKTLGALIYGRKREVTIVGIASSPEFVFAVAPGAMLPEPERFGVLWRATSTASSNAMAGAAPTAATACSRRASWPMNSPASRPWQASCRRSSCWWRRSCSMCRCRGW
jgi:putative ABC transport system permease protein